MNADAEAIIEMFQQSQSTQTLDDYGIRMRFEIAERYEWTNDGEALAAVRAAWAKRYDELKPRRGRS